MYIEIENLLSHAIKNDEEAQEALTSLALIIEKHVYESGDDLTYQQFLSKEMYEYNLNEEEFSELKIRLKELLYKNEGNEDLICWALVKAHDEEIKNELIKLLKIKWQKNPKFAKQVLYGLDSYKFSEYQDLLNEILSYNGDLELVNIAREILNSINR